MSDVDIIEEMRKTGSQKRYRPDTLTSNGTQQPIRVARASANRTAEQPFVVRTASQQRTADYRGEPRTNAPRAVQQQQPLRRTTQVYQEQQILPDTDTDVEVASSVRPRSTKAAPPTRELPLRGQKSSYGWQPHWLFLLGVGMCSMLAVWLLGVQVVVWWANAYHDPNYYTQTAHLDTVTVTTDAQGHQSQVRAFLDAQGHLDLLVLPVGGDTSKAHVVVGPTPFPVTNLRHATITVTARGTVVIVTVQGPLEANILATTRQSSVWPIDLKQKGGH